MGAPDLRKQQLMHLFGAKVCSKLAAVEFIQKQLSTRSRYHQSSLLVGAPIYKFEAMQLPNMKLSMGVM